MTLGDALILSTLTVKDAELLQPFTSVPRTVYVVVELGDTFEILPTFKSGCHVYPFAPTAVKSLDSPSQRRLSPEIVTVGLVKTETTT
jgi:hypothetical protein